MTRLAIIPARGGSKRIPRKNIRPFHGKPIIAWSIEAALRSGCFDAVVVSTDDEEIAAVARQHGATTPFLRPEALSGDHAPTVPVVRHAIDWFAMHDRPPGQVCCIYATAPFVRAADLQRGLTVLTTSGADYAFSATSYPFPIQRAIRVDAQGQVSMFSPESFGVRSQDLEPAFHDAGQFYWGTSVAWRTNDLIFSPTSRAVLMPRRQVQDIDTLEDWEIAELLFTVQRPDA